MVKVCKKCTYYMIKLMSVQNRKLNSFLDFSWLGIIKVRLLGLKTKK